MDESAAAPFTDGRWLLSHNGRVTSSVLPARHDAESVCDSALLAAHVFAEGPERVVETIRDVATADPDATLNVLLTDGTRITAISWGDPLSYLVGADGVVVASEPYDDDPRWVEVPDRHLVEVDGRGRVRHGAAGLISPAPINPALDQPSSDQPRATHTTAEAHSTRPNDWARCSFSCSTSVASSTVAAG